ncbi:uncharacterized protein EDB93DRAFT_1097000 [Suillus bovinus]|uniref:uncharacterized protein n=1 Tax=Suillus bovinus TaxID=48563 RepID=UPI001B85DEF1|nr:uncharacterized protein EDB93DRAFT_1097000 [Suillus bovinus]KAG2126626.1 hypothetical protein EDB93DRAFT_1097000 [Suillus bovinus]
MWKSKSLAPSRPPRPGQLQQVFCTVSIYNLILRHLSPRTLVWLSQTCRYMYVACTRFFRCAYNINRHLSRYFPEPLAFRSLQARTGLVISGFNAMHFMDRNYHASDLDLYAHPGHVHELSEWLVSVGYVFEPTQHQHKDWHENVSAGWDSTEKRFPRGQAGNLGHPAVTAILFKRLVIVDGKPVELKVQVTETTCNPIETILKSHSTCVLNIITFDAAHSFYPMATFEERMTLRIPQSGLCLDALGNCVKKGWRVYTLFRPQDIVQPSESPFFPNETRWVGDSRCWSILLDTSGVQSRPAPSPSSEQFSWDPSMHNGWRMSFKDAGTSPIIKVPTMDAHLVMTTAFRYNYIVPDEALALGICIWSVPQDKIYRKVPNKQDWIWSVRLRSIYFICTHTFVYRFDAEIPRFREAQNKLAGFYSA